MVDGKINFIDSTIFIDEGEIKFRKYWKNGPGTVTSNYRTSVMPKKYLNNIFTKLHRIRNVSSDEGQFEIGLNEMRDILSKNGYPKSLVENKIKTFLLDDKNPPPSNS